MSTVRIGRDDYEPTRQPKDGNDLSHARHVPALPIPDLRFEHTYLKNIRPHIRVEHTEEQPSESLIPEKSGETHDTLTPKDVVHVAWGKIIWITTKEQIISPLVQGVLWGVIRWYFMPGAVGLGQSFRAWWRNGDTLSAKRRPGRQSIDGVRNLVFGRQN